VTDDEPLRQQLVALLKEAHAHLDLESVLERVPPAAWSGRLPGAPYTPWQLLEHLRIAQWDILEFSRNAAHVSPEWPGDYWSDSEAPPSAETLRASLTQVIADLQSIADLVADSRTDLFARIPHGEGQTILREALLVADHNAYHLGQIVMLLKQLGTWPSE
jgi:uncharacterized damage-inducible protein DinB